MIYLEKPADWSPKFEVIGGYVEHDGKLLVLKRKFPSDEHDRWASAGGKIDPGELRINAVIREVNEETGLVISESQITYCGCTFVRFDSYDFLFHMHHILLDGDKPFITHNLREHSETDFKCLDDALSLPLMTDEPDSIRLMYKHLQENNVSSKFFISPENLVFDQEL